MRRRAFAVTSVLVMMHLLSGCMNRVELNDLALVTAVGVDKMEDDSVRLTMQVAVPRLLGSAGQGSSQGSKLKVKSIWVISEQGKSIVDAYNRMQSRLPRRIFFGQSRIIVVGEKMARSGVGPILDFFSRNREARLQSYIVFTRGEALDIMKFQPKLERVPAEVIREEQALQKGVKVNLKEFLDKLLSDGDEPLAPEIAIVPSVESDNMAEETNLSTAGIAVFKKDRLIGWIKKDNVREAGWVRDQAANTVITIDVPEGKGKGQISAQLVRGKTKLHPILQNGEILMQITIICDGVLSENSSSVDVSKPQQIKQVESWVEQEIETKMKEIVEIAQKEFKSDIFGFGKEVWRTYPKEWEKVYKEQWDEQFPKVKVTVGTRVVLEQTGLTNQTLTEDEKGEGES